MIIPKDEKKCICKERLGSGVIHIHLSWCPESSFYKEAVEEYDKSCWLKRLFLVDPRKYYYRLIYEDLNA
jgi:hypothetical protein